MPTDENTNDELEWIRNLPIRSEEIGFAPDELINCKKCGKPNGPNRAACIYCGDVIDATKLTKLDARELESWENGFNVIVLRSASADIDRAIDTCATLLGEDRETWRSMFDAAHTVPIARLESNDQAALLSEKLDESGIVTRIVSDELLQTTVPHVRLRSITFQDEGIDLENFNLGDIEFLKYDDLALIVCGTMLNERAETVKKKGRKAKTVRETLTTSDEQFIDIYTRANTIGWRIGPSGFDFSCLGPQKTLLVAENLKSLTTKLVELSPGTKIVDDYETVRPVLESCWPSGTSRDVDRGRYGSKQVAKLLATDNTLQMTKYSRLHWHLL